MNVVRRAASSYLLSISLVLGGLVVEILGLCLVSPITPSLIKKYPVSMQEGAAATVLIASFPLGQLFGSMTLGWISDHYGRKTVLVAALVLSGAFYFGQAVATSYVMFCLFRLVCGFFCGTRPCVLAYIADIVPADEVAKYASIMGIIGSATLAISPIIGASLATINLSVPFYVSGGASLSVASLMMVFMINVKTHKDIYGANSRRLKLSHMSYSWWVTVAATLVSGSAAYFCWSAWCSIIPLYTIDQFDLTPTESSLILSGQGVVAIVSNMFIFLPLSKKLPMATIATVCSLILIILFIVPLVSSIAGTCIIAVVFALGGSMLQASLTVLIKQLAPLPIRGKVTGLFFSFQNSMAVVGPLSAGQVYDMERYLPFVLWSAAGCLSFLTMVSAYKPAKHAVTEVCALDLTIKGPSPEEEGMRKNES